MAPDRQNPIRVLVFTWTFAALGVAQDPEGSFFEIEPNNTKPTANPFLINPPATVAGSVDPSSADYFLLTMAPPSFAGWHRYTMSLSTSNLVASVRGLTNTGSCPAPTNTDAELQATIPGFPNQALVWYGFGPATAVHVKVQSAGTSPVSRGRSRVNRSPRWTSGISRCRTTWT